MGLPTWPLSPTSRGNESLVQNQKIHVFKTPVQGRGAARLLAGGKQINGLAICKAFNQLSKNKISFTWWTEVILRNVLLECPKDTLV